MAKSIKSQGAAGTGAGGDDDLAAYNLDNYDEEESTGVGELFRYILELSPSRPRSSYSHGSLQQHQGLDLLRRQ